jgi:peptidoglycan/xylan/chitin deacetylase (PgdA/CDA1 family)
MYKKPIKIPILVYHHLTNDEKVALQSEEDFYTVTVSQFKEQLERLYRKGYFPITPDELIMAQEKKMELPKRTIMLTFDDGHISNYTLAYPLLKQYNFKAVFFAVIENIGANNFMTWDQLKEISAHNILIGSHGMSHRFLSKLGPAEIEKELINSRSILEDGLGRPVKYLAVPGGFYNNRVKRAAKAAGYLAVCTSDFGLNYVGSDLFALRRFGIRHNTTLKDFKIFVQPKRFILFFRTMLWKLRYILKNVIGVDNYTSIKEFVIRRKRPTQLSADDKV